MSNTSELQALKYVLNWYNDFGNFCASTDSILENRTKVEPIIGNDKKTLENIKKRIKDLKKLAIDNFLRQIYLQIGMDAPHNHDDILEFVVEDVEETADPENWHDGDVAIAFRRWIEAQSENQP